MVWCTEDISIMAKLPGYGLQVDYSNSHFDMMINQGVYNIENPDEEVVKSIEVD